ncbi:extracellular solute-binding protein [Paenibacillus eucommiae]|uniref:Multiple sugar transport system substrate-binding protein n=1 Tax=Paenibacillus eucommiae TaxID=1355755 RepID=A0ABS4ILJ2_9BACL|nr:extracellular solute-binding protein [Paenibacillus eucommiae]MBP1988440.1 multiple sugar transport system substrate-binding protein [Paenibacillus eucommiae]
MNIPRQLPTLLSLLSLLLVIGLLLQGCTKAPSEPPAENGGRPAMIKFVAAEYSTATKPFLENLVRDFKSLNPNIDVELQVMNWDILLSVYSTMISKNPPDLLTMNGYAHYVADDLLNNMEEIVSPELMNKFYPHYLKSDRVNEVQYVLPFVASIRGMYYNKDIFDELGISSPPRTWAELQEDASKIRDTHKMDGFGVDLSDNEIYAYLSYFFFGAGGGWLKDGKWNINSAENVEGLTFLKELYDKGLTDAEPTVTSRDEKQRILGNGKLGMLISGNYFSAVVPKEFPGLRWGTGPIPVKEGVAPFSFGVQDVIMSFKTDHTDKEALSKFLDFFYEDSRYEEFMIREGFLPTIQTVGESMSRNNPEMQGFLDSISKAEFYPIVKPGWQSVMEGSRKMGEAVLLGQMTPQAALDQLQQIAVSKGP